MSKKHLDFKRMLDDTDFSDPSSIERYAANLDAIFLSLALRRRGKVRPRTLGPRSTRAVWEP